MKTVIAILFLGFLMVGCASSPGYQSFYVGDGNLQWYIQPIALDQGKDGTVTVDITYRRIRNQENFVRVNLTWQYVVAPRGVPTLFFDIIGAEMLPVGKTEILFKEQAQKSIRLAAIMKESDFLRLLKNPHGNLCLMFQDSVVTFPISKAFENVLKDLAFELQ